MVKRSESNVAVQQSFVLTSCWVLLPSVDHICRRAMQLRVSIHPKRMTSLCFQCIVTVGRLGEDLKVLEWHQTGKLSSDWASEPHILRVHEDVTEMQMALSI